MTGGLEWVRALYRAPKSGIIPRVVPKPGRAYYNSGPVVQILAAAFTVVALRCRAMGSLVLAAQERLGNPNGDGKAECVVVTVREAGVAPLRPGGASIGLQVGPLVSFEESTCTLRSVQG